MKKIVICSIVLILASGVITFAGGKSQSAQANDGDVRIVVSRWAGGHADDMKKVAAGYTKSRVVIDDIGYENLQQKQIQSMTTTGDYDVIYFQEIWMADYIRNGWVIPLDDYIAKSGLDLKAFSPAFLDAGRVNGRIYALPSLTHTYIMVYNKEQLDKDGKTIPRNTDELVQLASFYKNKGTGIAIPAGQGQAAADVFSSILFSAGGEYLDKNGKLALTSEPVLYAAKIWDQLCENSATGATAWLNEDCAEAIRTGVAPFGVTISDTNFLDMDPERSRIIGKAEYGPIPSRNEPTGLAGVWSFGITANSKHKNEAFDFITWMIAPAQDKAMALINSHTSALPATANDPEVIKAFPFMPAVAKTLERAKYNPLNPGASALMPALQAALSELATTNHSPEEVFGRLQKELEGVVTSN
jgi:ABC-type glycerol-3-phosphate transport system substrate-binding protein